MAQSLISKAPSVKSTMPAGGPTQQNETDKVSDLKNISFAKDKSKKGPDYTARRHRRRPDRRERHADPARSDKITQAGGQPILNHNPNSLVRRLLSSPNAQKIPTQSARTPSFSSESAISAMVHSQGPTAPPPILVGPEGTLIYPNPISFNPFMSSTTPTSETQSPQRLQQCVLDRLPRHPNPMYLCIASSVPTHLSIPQCLLVVLDLNGTLLFREVSSTKYKPRPFLMNFLDYCLENHVILIWSSAKPHNVEAVCQQLFTPEQRQKLLGVWARDTLGLTPAQYNTKTQVYKHLDRIWADPIHASKHPWFQQQGIMWSQKNTLLVDDSILKAKAQPYNHVQIPEFVKNSNEATAYKGKDILGQITAYLEEARMWDNVSAFVLQTRFEVDHQWSWDWGEEKQDLRNEVDITGHGHQKAVRGRTSRGVKKGKEEEEKEEVQLSDDEEDGGVKLPINEGLKLPTGL